MGKKAVEHETTESIPKCKNLRLISAECVSSAEIFLIELTEVYILFIFLHLFRNTSAVDCWVYWMVLVGFIQAGDTSGTEEDKSNSWYLYWFY